ncbi:hypothetical protein IQ07DRAFT_225761 [Pyrenochaeta sp. DS3sAY3a]|nr:hypothetical protein IQ07DRAFT_225761 [Pyrenochaeta sp. DS3sAY3a]
MPANLGVDQQPGLQSNTCRKLAILNSMAYYSPALLESSACYYSFGAFPALGSFLPCGACGYCMEHVEAAGRAFRNIFVGISARPLVSFSSPPDPPRQYDVVGSRFGASFLHLLGTMFVCSNGHDSSPLLLLIQVVSASTTYSQRESAVYGRLHICLYGLMIGTAKGSHL